MSILDMSLKNTNISLQLHKFTAAKPDDVTALRFNGNNVSMEIQTKAGMCVTINAWYIIAILLMYSQQAWSGYVLYWPHILTKVQLLVVYLLVILEWNNC